MHRSIPNGAAALAVVLLMSAQAAAQTIDFSRGHWVDLSHAYSDDTLYWPTVEHGGTHLDAPIHFYAGGRTADQVPIEALTGSALVIDASEAAAGDPDYQMSADDLRAWEREYGAIEAGAIVLVRTGWAERWPDVDTYLGTARKGPEAVTLLHFPGIGADAAELLADRQVAAVGIDTASVDHGQSKDFMTHRILYEANIPGFENVADLSDLPPRGTWLAALPMKIAGGSGAPLRIAAFVPDAAAPDIRSEVLLKGRESWNGAALPAYPAGAPEITMVRVVIPPGDALPVHRHPVITGGMVLRGRLTVDTQDGETITMGAGDPLLEVVDTWHAGRNPGTEPTELFVFYAGAEGTSTTVPRQGPVATPVAGALPEGFVYADDIPGLRFDLRYRSDDNFVGAPVTGYRDDRLIMTRAAARALEAVQAQLTPMGLGLLVYDAYRPQRAVDHFARWAEDLDDERTKATYYPDVDKADLFDEGYIAARSGHSRGSTVDLTPVDLASGEPLDMGTPWDHFGPESWPSWDGATPQQRANRLLLRSMMLKQGFEPYEQEWWHFTLADEPFPNTYFDFPVE